MNLKLLLKTNNWWSMILRQLNTIVRLNDILAANNGVAPANLQEQIDAWQPKSEDDKAPVTVDFSKMVAYLYGENIGQEDEAWFSGQCCW